MISSYLRFPHLQGDTVVFVAEDDVWSAPVAGGRAHRISGDAAPVRNPRLSPDGTLVAWASARDGAREVTVGAVDGGGATRLTYWGDHSTTVLGWTADGDVLAVTAAGQPDRHRTWAYAVPAAGGVPRRLDLGPVADVALGRGSAPTVLRRTSVMTEMAWWKRYRGGSAGQLWADRATTGEFARILADVDGNLASPMLVGRGASTRIAFLSDHEGWGNLYSVDLDGGALRRHTDHGGADAPAFYVRHASTDGTRVVYESAGQLWLVDRLTASATPQRIDIRLGGPRAARTPERIDAGWWMGAARPDRTGRTSVVTVRGTVHRLAHRDGPARTLLSEPGVRARQASPLGADRAVWVDDADGEDTLCVVPLDPRAPDAPQVQRHGTGALGRVLQVVPAPDGSAVAVTTHDGRLLVLDVDEGDLREIAHGTDGEIRGPAWSPDSAWLAYVEPARGGLSRVMLTRLADDEQVQVTEPRFSDASPAFSSDGRYLAFLSRRSFDPIYDEHSFDLSFPASWRPFLVPLAARTPSPFGASPDGRPVSPAEETPEDPPAAPDEPPTEEAPDAVPAKPEERPEDTVPEVVVDVDGLAARVVPVPVAEGRYRGMRAGRDCLLWYRQPVSGLLGDGRGEDEQGQRPVLERYDLVRRRLDVVADPVSSFAVSGDGTRLLVRDRTTMRVLRTDRSSSAPPTDGDADEFTVDTRRIAVTVDPTAEWRQMYAEAGRLMRDHFWSADMAGVDWQAELDRYRPLVDAVGSHDDLVDLLWEVQGELGTSHAYVWGGGAGGDGQPGFLGADLAPDPDGGWRVARVLPPESSAPAARSPLSGPGVDVRAGDTIVEVAGRVVDAAHGPAPLLVGLAEELVELTVRDGADREHPGRLRRVAVRPLGSEDALRYQDWVAGRRAFVVERSGGRLGYLHVPDMMAPGWAQLHRDLAKEVANEGLVLDVRGNAGGHTSQLVVEKLARRVIGWDVIRHQEPVSYPQDAPRGPIVALADEMSGSDGDIVTAAIRRMGLAPVVGTRTWGGVIGIDSRYGLVDGTGVTQPRYAFWFDDHGWGVENHGVDPDVEVEITPQDWAAGRDPQLERAVDLALATLAERPAATPPDPATRPSRQRPQLPPRPRARRKA